MKRRVRIPMLIAAAVAASSVVIAGQQPARGGRPAAPTGTATLSGVVLFDDANPRPARGAIVNLSQTDRTYADTTVADDEGRFTFRGLPAGRYDVSSERAGWIEAHYGATRPGRAGTPMAVAEGQRVEGVTLKLLKGAVLTGTVRDPDGEPAAGVRIAVLRVITAGGTRRFSDYYGRALSSSVTDDHGEYRMFGLPPDDYIVRIMPAARVDVDSAHQMTPADLAWARGIAAGGASAGAAPPKPPPQTFVSYAPLYYPGTLKKSAAAVITLGPGEERSGLDFTLALIPTFTVDTTVTTADGKPAFPDLYLVEVGGEGGGWYGIREGHGSSFAFTGVAPGTYAVAAVDREREPKLWATAMVSVSTQNQPVSLILQPGLSASGQVVFQGSKPAPADLTRLSLSMSAVGVSGGLTIEPSTAHPADNGTFVLAGLMPGSYRLQAFVPGGPQNEWVLQSAMVGTQDIADYPLDIRENSPTGKITVTFTDKPTELGGRLEDASGRAASDYFIIVFSSDERTWSERSRRIVQTRPASDGRFLVRGLPPGEYFLAALTDVEENEWYDPGFLRDLIPKAAKIQMSAGEHKIQDIKIVGTESISARASSRPR